LDVYHTVTHDVALVQIYNAGLKCAENTGCRNSPFAHHCTTLWGYIFTTEACIDNQKENLLNSNISSTCPHNMVN